MISLSESQRVKDIAIKTYPKGRLIIAFFKYGVVIKQIHYITPDDIPLEVCFDPFKSAWFRLYSVKSWQKVFSDSPREKVHVEKSNEEVKDHSLSDVKPTSKTLHS